MNEEQADLEPHRVLFTYWGRRGLTRFAYEVFDAAMSSHRIAATISVSRQNENFGSFGKLDSNILEVDTFTNSIGALTEAWRIPLLRRRLAAHIALHRIQAVVELMPHAWSSFVFPQIRPVGVRYATIIHDAQPHPGDYRSSIVARLVERSIGQADLVLTLSEVVAGQLRAAGKLRNVKQSTLFHPDLHFGASRKPGVSIKEPLRLAFFGRIMAYKGLPLFLDMVDVLRGQGIEVEVGVFGEGALGENFARLVRLKAEVVNRWLPEDEIGAILSRYHAVVLSHLEASQSGVAATAFGAGVPVIATPVGGLIEQVQDGLNGVLAQSVDAAALAEAARRLLFEPELYQKMIRNIADTSQQRSMTRFVDECVMHALRRNEQ